MSVVENDIPSPGGGIYYNEKWNLDVATLFLEYLKLEGVSKVFGVPGGAIVYLLEALGKQRDQFDFVVCRHEGGAAFIAHGYSVATQGLGVVLTTTGPGAINALTGVINADECGASLLVVTGEVAQQYFGRGYLQAGIDARLDIGAIYRNSVQSSGFVTSEANFATVLEKALRDARSIPGSATHISIPADVAAQRVLTPRGKDAQGNVRVLVPNSTERYRAAPGGTDTVKVGLALDALAAAQRPLLFLGNGCRDALREPSRMAAFTALVERFAFPVMTTPDAKGIFPESHSLSLRNYGISECLWPRSYMTPEGSPPYDALMVIGSSLGEFATSISAADFYSTTLEPSEHFIQVDLNQGVIGRNFPVTLGIVAEAGATIDALCSLAGGLPPPSGALSRLKLIAEIKKDPGSAFEDPAARASGAVPLNPAAIVAVINEEVDEGHIFIDSGNCVGWSLHYMVIDPPVQYHIGLAMAPMGSAVAAIGAKMGAPEQTCVAITGDGAFLMHGTELSTAAQHGVGAVFVVLYDNDLGMVTQAMGLWFPPAEQWQGPYRLGAPDLVKFSKSLGAQATLVTATQGTAEFRTALRRALRRADKDKQPQVVVATIDATAKPPYGFPRLDAPAGGASA
jgi:acetolactate synthase-1/2/3 large subunit